MRKLIIVGVAAIVSLVPAAAGLAANPSFSHQVVVPAKQVKEADDLRQLSVEPGDDRGRGAELGDDRGGRTQAEPGDDRGSSRDDGPGHH